MTALGFRFETPGRIIAFSGDTARSESIAALAKGADVLVHETMYEPGIDAMDFAGAKIPEKMIDRRQGVRPVRAVVEILHGKALARMRVCEAEFSSAQGVGPQTARRSRERNAREHAGEKRAAGMIVHGET